MTHAEALKWIEKLVSQYLAEHPKCKQCTRLAELPKVVYDAFIVQEKFEFEQHKDVEVTVVDLEQVDRGDLIDRDALLLKLHQLHRIAKQSGQDDTEAAVSMVAELLGTIRDEPAVEHETRVHKENKALQIGDWVEYFDEGILLAVISIDGDFIKAIADNGDIYCLYAGEVMKTGGCNQMVHTLAGYARGTS